MERCCFPNEFVFFWRGEVDMASVCETTTKDQKKTANHIFLRSSGTCCPFSGNGMDSMLYRFAVKQSCFTVCFDVAKPDPKQCKRCPFFNTFGGPIAMFQRCKFISNFQNDRASLPPLPQLLVDRCPTALDWHLISTTASCSE